MTSPFGLMQLIVNPRAGRGAVERGWPAVRRLLEAEDLEHVVTFTERPGHATEAARAAIESGCRFVVAVGGDGTVNEVVNGMMGDEGPLDPEAVLGVVAAGSGSDFVRTFGMSHEAGEAARHLAGKTLWGSLDVGRVRYRAPDGREARRWFVNIAEAGIGAHVVREAARMPRRFGGRAYRLGALKAILTYRPQEGVVEMLGRKARGVRPDTPLEQIRVTGRMTMVVVANGQFFGGGLRVAPRAIPQDAMFDVLVGRGSKWDAVKALQRMPRGQHVPHPTIAEYVAERVTVDGPEPVAIEADGEPLGTTPAAFELAAASIRMKI